MGRKLTTWIILAALLGGTVFYLSPYWSIASLGMAAQEGDPDRIEDHVDFAEVKENFRAELTASMHDDLEELGGNPFAALGATLGKEVVDRMVDAMITPEYFARALGSVPDGGRVSRAEMMREVMQDEETEWVNASTFRVRTDDGVTLTWRRSGLTWRLTRVSLPESPDKDGR